MKRFVISEDLLAANVRYLHGRPFGEVYVLIQALQGLPDYVEPEPDKSSADDVKDSPKE